MTLATPLRAEIEATVVGGASQPAVTNPAESGAADPTVAGGASQPVASDPGALPIAAMARNALMHNVAESILQSIDEYWRERADSEQVAKGTVELRKLLFSKRKHAVPEDLWLESGAPGGKQQHVSAVVSETYVLQQLRKVVETREEWRRQEKLPMDCQMRTGEDLQRDLF